MRYGFWTPLPHAVRGDDAMAEAVADLRTAVVGDAAKSLGVGFVGMPHQIADRVRYFESIVIECPIVHFYPMKEGLETFAPG